MNENKPNLLKTRVKVTQSILKLIFIVGILTLILAILFIITLSFTSKDNFNISKLENGWYLTYNLSKVSFLSFSVPYRIIQPVDNSLINAKLAFLIYLLSRILIYLSASLYGIKQIINILTSTINDYSPFNKSNIKSLKKLAFLIIGFSIIADLLLDIICCLFVTRIFLIDLSNISIYGIFIGFLILIISDIFEYGVYLQNENDTLL
ncbi:MAG: DUF2975 domain-containing protein [Bacillota bacterium]|nr:DUF2975 domain-containing protein [Bacillota bacterium]